MSAQPIIDPRGPARDGVWHGSVVRVRRQTAHGLLAERFRVMADQPFLDIEHAVSCEELNDDLAVELAGDLIRSAGALTQREFEEALTGVVLTTDAEPLVAWRNYYENSLSRLASGEATFAPVHQHAMDLVVGSSVFDVGSCFGFFPIALARSGYRVIGSDITAPTMGLLAAFTDATGLRVPTVVCSAGNLPASSGSVDTVSILHLLEHLATEDLLSTIRDAVRVARHRVVIAVPFEEVPTECFGHVQSFTLESLMALAASIRAEDSTLVTSVSEHHGGWLVVDHAR